MKNKKHITAGIITIACLTTVECYAVYRGINGACLKSYLAITGFVFAGIVGYKFPFSFTKD